MLHKTITYHAAGVAALVAVVLGADIARADAVGEFYKDKQIRMIIRAGTGTGYDTAARLLTRHMMKYIPGKPTVVNTNMPGAGGITSANYVANIAPRDGTILTIVGVGLPIDQAVDLNPALKADLTKFNWVGNLSSASQIMLTWHTSPTKTLEDATKRETVIAAAGAGSISSMFPLALNSILGTKFKIIVYQGGGAMDLAMERGEVEGRGTLSYAALAATKPHYVSDKLINVLVQIGMERSKAMPDARLLLEYAKTEEQRQIFEFMSKAVMIGQPIATTPDVPRDRVDALRRAFDSTMKDPGFDEEGEKQGVEITPMSGQQTQKFILDLMATPQPIKDKVKAAFQSTAGMVTKPGK